jgi:DNA gyrase subunit A
VGENMRSGMVLFDVARFGKIVAAGWVFDETEVFIGTKMGKGIRFAHKRTHPNGSLGIRLDPNDVPVAITGVNDDSGVFLLSHDGKGSVRLMEGFRSTKSPGAGGKVALKTEHMVAAIHVTDEDDVFCLSELGKLIRFQAVEIPPKTGTVQGVNCMSLRADACTTATISR